MIVCLVHNFWFHISIDITEAVYSISARKLLLRAYFVQVTFVGYHFKFSHLRKICNCWPTKQYFICNTEVFV